MKGIQLMFAKECELSGAKQKSPRLNCREVNAMTFDELRYIEFNKKKVSVLWLPPASHSIRQAHVRRWFYLLKSWVISKTILGLHLIQPSCLNAYVWKLNDGDFYQEKKLNLLPDKFWPTCGCTTGCAAKRCKCRKVEAHCTDYCKCVNCTNRWA